jgi:hypothetical protein
MTEIRLTGPGAGGGTIRVGQTVRREPDRAPEAMIETLRYLEAVGFAGAPRVLGRDSAGRWVLSYMAGDVAMPPYQAWAAEDALLSSVGELLRDYHRAVAGFRPPATLRWPSTPPASQRGILVGHLDVSMANVVCQGGRAVALIDFEEVGLVTRLWDVVRTVRHWVPLLAPADIPAGLAAVRGRQFERLRIFADSYGLTATERQSLPGVALLNADDSYEHMRQEAARGHPGFLAEWNGEHARRNRRARTWIQEQGECLERCLLSPSVPG